MQERGGIARHDAVAWGYARGADALGIDIIQNCEVTGFRREGGASPGWKRRAVRSAPNKVAIVAAGHIGAWRKAGFSCRSKAITLQAFVSRTDQAGARPRADVRTVHVYLSQSDKGELVFGGGLDLCLLRAARRLARTSIVVASIWRCFPRFSRLSLMRQWAGTVDVSRLSADHRPRAARRMSSSIAAGARAASRPFRPAATRSPIFRDRRTPPARRAFGLSTVSPPAG